VPHAGIKEGLIIASSLLEVDRHEIGLICTDKNSNDSLDGPALIEMLRNAADHSDAFAKRPWPVAFVRLLQTHYPCR
jgi:hypothetical protein